MFHMSLYSFQVVTSVMNLIWLPMQLVLLASFAVTMVNVFPPPTVAMEEVVDVVMAVMREDAVSWLRVNST